MKKTLAAVFVVSVISTAALAAGPCIPNQSCPLALSVSSSAKVSENRFYTGLVWQLGGNTTSNKPDFVFGLRRSTTKNIDKVTGADLSFKVSYDQKLTFDSVRLSYLGGKPSALAQIGAGYSFKNNSALATGAIQAAHLRLSSDYVFSQSKFQYFAEINTLKKPKKSGAGGSSCPTGYAEIPEELKDEDTLKQELNLDEFIYGGQVGIEFARAFYGLTPEQILGNVDKLCVKEF
jgi:hypothetical protein